MKGFDKFQTEEEVRASLAEAFSNYGELLEARFSFSLFSCSFLDFCVFVGCASRLCLSCHAVQMCGDEMQERAARYTAYHGVAH